MEQLALYYLFDGYRAKLLSITATAATTIDGDLFKQVHQELNLNSPAYAHLRSVLAQVLAANQRPGTRVQRIFTVSRSASDPKVLIIGADTEENVAVRARPGEAYRTASTMAGNFDQPLVEDAFVRDEFGVFLHAYAPVRDRAGNIVGAVVVAVDESRVKSKMRPILMSSLLSMTLAGLIAIPAALFVKPAYQPSSARASGGGRPDWRRGLRSPAGRPLEGRVRGGRPSRQYDGYRPEGTRPREDDIRPLCLAASNG